MTETATGLVLRTYPLTESSLIVHWLTPGLGRLATVAKGARKPKSAFRGKLDLFYLADFSFARSRLSELHTLREVNVRDTHSALRRDLEWLQQASYCAGLIEQATETETPLPELFELLRELLEIIPLAPARPETIFAFELRSLAELGLDPDLDRSALTPGAKELMRTLAHRDWASVSILHSSPQQRQELARFLHGFLIYHLGRLPKGRGPALAI